MNDSTRTPHDHDAQPPRDALDTQLRAWHDLHRARATASRDQVLAAVQSAGGPVRRVASPMRQWLSLAAMIALAALVGFFASQGGTERGAFASGGLVMVPEGGRLDALDPTGRVIGPCPLQHTDVVADVSGPFSRVTVKQTYTNMYPQKIEAVYTFPLSHRAAVDRMRMRIITPEGERVVDGEVKERSAARQMYESAREAGYVASLLEQERPNIFTQSVANIESGATVEVEIAYVETLQSRDGVYSFDFPTVVGPRYIPGTPTIAGHDPQLPPGVEPCAGAVLLGPCQVDVTSGEAGVRAADVLTRLTDARAVHATDEAIERCATEQPIDCIVVYANQSKESCQLYPCGLCHVNSRWCWAPAAPGAPFAKNTDQVPDAARITPMPVPPTKRAGHDLSIRVNIDSGGPGITDIDSTQHEIVEDLNFYPGALTKRSVSLAGGSSIPNRDFVLSWRLQDDAITEGVFAHAQPIFMSGGRAASVQDEFKSSSGDAATWVDTNGFFTIVLNPPARAAVDPAAIRGREVVFVLDTSGSMSGFPQEKSKELMRKALAALRPQDTFNVITFAGATTVMWPEPRAGSAANIAAALGFVDSRGAGGGTEMMTAINAALVRPRAAGGAITPVQLADLPADGRAVKVRVPYSSILADGNGALSIRVRDGLVLPMVTGTALPTVLQPEGVFIDAKGRWETRNGERRLKADTLAFADKSADPMRVVVFLTDAYIGNDQAIVQAIHDNAGSTRVFSLGIGNSVNRWLIDSMAAAGRGASEIVLLSDDGDAAVDRLVKRIQTPVLTDISVEFEGVTVQDVIPSLTAMPDLFDAEPLVIKGRYARSGVGAAVIRGTTAAGPWERRVQLNLPVMESAHAVCQPVWARAKVDQVLLPHLAALEQGSVPADVTQQIVSLGESFHIMTPFTSFVAVEKARVTVGGKAMLVHVPIEFPQGLRWEGFFGEILQAPGREEERLAEGRRSTMASSVNRALAPNTASPVASPVVGSVREMTPAPHSRSVRMRSAPPPPLAPPAGAAASSQSFKLAVAVDAPKDEPVSQSAPASDEAGARGAVGTVSAATDPSKAWIDEPAVLTMYDIRDLVKAGGEPTEESERLALELVTAMQGAVQPAVWVDRGGFLATWTGKRGVLVIHAPQAMQAEIAKWLDARRAAAIAGAGAGVAGTLASAAVIAPAELDLLWDRMDQQLLLFALYGDRPATPEWTKHEGKIMVTIRVSGVSVSTSDELAKVGCTVDAVNQPTRVVVARVAREDLVRLALVSSVEFVEPIRFVVCE
ncbi:MAG: VIT and VWA domain-containing protein [Planctomycetota bacterium]|nr:VIT and VWA domain-containing protein [Planctomycetota bacterium]MDA1105382.1 VIT and VWA domain-containing protein [Planctomycetota bacterium]